MFFWGGGGRPLHRSLCVFLRSVREKEKKRCVSRLQARVFLRAGGERAGGGGGEGEEEVVGGSGR